MTSTANETTLATRALPALDFLVGVKEGVVELTGALLDVGPDVGVVATAKETISII